MLAAFRNFYQAQRVPIILFVTAFVFHAAMSAYLYYRFGDSVLWFQNEDAQGYVELARNVLTGRGFTHDGAALAIRTPAWPLMLSLGLLLPGSATAAILFLQVVLLGASGIIIYKIGELFFSKFAGLIASTLYIVEPYLAMNTALATTEVFFNFGLLITVYCFGRWYLRRDSQAWLAASGLWLGLCILIRPVALYLPFLFLIFIIIRHLRFKKSTLSLLVSLFILSATTTLVVAPWSIRQYIRFGTPRITNIDAMLLYFRVAPLVIGAEQGISYNAAIQQLHGELERSVELYNPDDLNANFVHYEFMSARVAELVRQRPDVVAKSYLASMVPALFGTGYEYMLEEVLGLERATQRPSYSALLARGDFAAYFRALRQIDIFQAVLLTGALLWMAAYVFIVYYVTRRFVWRERFLSLVLLGGLLGYFVFFALGPASHARYRLPTFPWWFLLIGASLDFIKQKRILGSRKEAASFGLNKPFIPGQTP